MVLNGGGFDMKDFKMQYRNENGEIINREYDTIMDFIEEMESNNIDVPMLDYEVISYTLFENPLNSGGDTTIGEILTHCKSIIR